jgi:hypothetical protein
MYRQPLNRPHEVHPQVKAHYVLPRIPHWTAPSHLGDLFFLPIFNPVPENLFPGYFFVRERVGCDAVAKKDKDRLSHPTAFERFSFRFLSPFLFQERGVFLSVTRYYAQTAWLD